MKVLPERHAWAQKANVERNWSVYIGGCDVLVQGDDAERVSAKIQEAFATEVDTLPSLVEQAATLFRRGALLGKRVSAGRHTPAVADGYSWCILDLQGAPLWLGHDLVAALNAFRWWESLDGDGLEENLQSYRQDPARDWTDEENETAALADRRDDLVLRGYLPREAA